MAALIYEDHGVRKLTAPWRHRVLVGKNLSGDPEPFVSCWCNSSQEQRLETLEIDYGDVELALDFETMHDHNRRHLHGDGDPFDGYRRNWYGDLPDVPGKPKANAGERVLHLLHSGVASHNERLRKLSADVSRLLPPLGFGRRKAFRRYDDGDEIDVGRYVEGDPKFWIDFNRSGRKPSPYVTIVGQWGANCMTSENEMFWQGAAAVVLTDALENAGFRVQLVAANLNAISNDGVCLNSLVSVVNLKMFDEPLRLGPVAFAMCHCGFFRTIGFGMFGQANAHLQPGLGSMRDLTISDLRRAMPGLGSVVLLGKAQTQEGCEVCVKTGIEALKKNFGLVDLAA
jgi:hypothetical protein